MPIYEFICENCDTLFETIVFSTDKKAVTCPKCDGHVKKLMSAPNSIQGDSGASASQGCGPAPSTGFS